MFDEHYIVGIASYSCYSRDSRQTINRNNNDVFTASKSWCVQNSRDNLISSTSGGSQFKSAILHQSRQISSLCLLEEEQILLNSRGTFLKYQKITNFFKASKVKNCNPLHAINAVLGIIRSKLWTSLLLYDLQQHHYCQGPSIPLYSSMLYYVLYQGGLKGGPRQPRPPIFGGK